MDASSSMTNRVCIVSSGIPFQVVNGARVSDNSAGRAAAAFKTTLKAAPPCGRFMASIEPPCSR